MPPEDTATRTFQQRLLPWTLLLPPALLAWPGPGAPLADDPHPHLAGTGWIALGALPLALLLLAPPARGTRELARAPLAALALVVAWVAAATFLGALADAWEARRLTLHLVTALLLLLGGARLDTRGAATFATGLVALSVVWTAGALLDGLRDGPHGLAGVLGNTGPLSQAALPGALIGAAWGAGGRGPRRMAGLLALVLFVVHAGLSPVHAGTLAAAGALLLAALRRGAGTAPGAPSRRGLTACALCVLAGALGLRLAPGDGPGTAARPTDVAELGGAEVRARIWSTIPRVLGDHPLAGLGPGQFRSGYPPYRDVREMEASRGGRAARDDTEVEHAHSDWLQGPAELGLLAGGLWVLFLLGVARAAWRSADRGAGLAVLGILLAALVHAPLTHNAAATAVAWGLFGRVLARGDGTAPDGTGVARAAGTRLVALALLVGLAIALPLVRFGLLESRGVRTLRAGLGALAGAGDAAALAARHARLQEQLVERFGDLAPVRFLAARRAAGEERVAAWEAALELRPHSVEALSGLGLAHVQAGRVAEARGAWERALALAPTQPRLLENLARLELFEGEPARGAAHLARLLAQGGLDGERRRAFGQEAVLRGLWEEGALLLAGAPLDALAPEALNAEAQAAKEGGDALQSESLRCLAHLLWGREHVANGDFRTAVRSYRQVLLPTRRVDPEGAPALRAELAAAELGADRPGGARETCAGLLVRDGIWRRLPGWARQALEDAGLPEGR